MTRVRPAGEPGWVLVDEAFLGVSFDLLAELLRVRYRRDGIAPPRGFAAELNEVLSAIGHMQKRRFAQMHASSTPVGSSGATITTTPASIEISEKVTSAEVAELIGSSTSYVNRLLRTGRLKGVKAGPVWLVDLQSVSEHFRAAS